MQFEQPEKYGYVSFYDTFAQNIKVTVKQLCEIFAVAPVFFIFDDVPDYIDDRLNDMLIAHYGAWFEEFLENISSLTEEGKAKARAYVEDLASIDRYRIPEYKSIRREKEERLN